MQEHDKDSLISQFMAEDGARSSAADDSASEVPNENPAAEVTSQSETLLDKLEALASSETSVVGSPAETTTLSSIEEPADSTEIAPVSIYKQYFESLVEMLGPSALRPDGGGKSGMLRIFLSVPDSNTFKLNIYRSIGNFGDVIEVQDEVHIDRENKGWQANFKLNENKKLTEFKDGEATPNMKRVLETFQEASLQEGAKIYTSGSGVVLVSDGQAWVEPKREPKVYFNKPEEVEELPEPEVPPVTPELPTSEDKPALPASNSTLWDKAQEALKRLLGDSE